MTLDGVTLDGVPFDDAGVAVQGGLTLDSDLELNNSRLIFDDSNPQAVGVGSLVSEAAILYGNIFNQSSQPVTFSPAITISGGELIDGLDSVPFPQESYFGPFINRGAIVASGDQLTINATTWVNDGTIAASSGTLNLYGNWTNNGSISADSSSTISLGSAIAIDPTSTAAAAYAWTNHGTITIAAGATVCLGGVFTTDEFAGSFADRGVTSNLAANTVCLIGTIDNSAADNPSTQGTLALSARDRPALPFRRRDLPGPGDNRRQRWSGGHLLGRDAGGSDYRGHAGHVAGLGKRDRRERHAGQRPEPLRIGTNVTVLGGLTLNANVYLSASDTYLYFNDTNPQAVNVGTIASSATIHLSGAGIRSTTRAAR